MAAAPAQLLVPTLPAPCSAHTRAGGIRSSDGPGGSSPALPPAHTWAIWQQDCCCWGQEKGVGERVRSVALAGSTTLGERGTFLGSCDWHMENVCTSQELLSWRKLSKYYFKQTVLFKGLYQTYFFMSLWFLKALTMSLSSPNAVNQERLECKNW